MAERSLVQVPQSMLSTSAPPDFSVITCGPSPALAAMMSSWEVGFRLSTRKYRHPVDAGRRVR